MRGLAALWMVAVAVGWWVLAPLPLWLGPLQLVPLLLFGVAVVLQATGGRGEGPLGRVVPASSVAWDLLAIVGAVMVGAGVLGMLKLTPANQARSTRDVAALSEVCEGPAPTRLDRSVLPLLERLEKDLPGLNPAVREALVERLKPPLERCVEQLRSAWTRPEGTHSSWSLLRDRLAGHPEWVVLPPEVEVEPRALKHRPLPPIVEVGL